MMKKVSFLMMWFGLFVLWWCSLLQKENITVDVTVGHWEQEMIDNNWDTNVLSGDVANLTWSKVENVDTWTVETWVVAVDVDEESDLVDSVQELVDERKKTIDQDENLTEADMELAETILDEIMKWLDE